MNARFACRMPFRFTLTFSIVSVVPWPLKGSGTLDLLCFGYNSCVSTHYEIARASAYTLKHVTRLIYDHSPSENGVRQFYMCMFSQDSTDELTTLSSANSSYSCLGRFLFSFIITAEAFVCRKAKKAFANYRCHWRCPAFHSLWYKWFLKTIRIISLAQHEFRIIFVSE